MRRGLLRLTVAVVVLLMVLGMAAPAFAAVWNTESGCRGDDLAFRATGHGLRLDHNGDRLICAHENERLPGTILYSYDNRI